MDKIERFFLTLHSDMPRQGPGSRATTAVALSMIESFSPGFSQKKDLQILDVGCGPGMQTVQLAEHFLGAKIKALDYYPQFFDELMDTAVERGVSNRIDPVEGSMFEMDFADVSFDVLWSEGAVYIMGFERGLKEWKRFLKPGGFMALSEISWLTDSRPADIEKYWSGEYPAIDTVAGNTAKIQAAGYSPIGTYVFPPQDWFEYYFDPLTERISLCRSIAEKDGENSAELLGILEAEEHEIELFRKFSGYYSYAFYIMRRPDL